MRNEVKRKWNDYYGYEDVEFIHEDILVFYVDNENEEKRKIIKQKKCSVYKMRRIFNSMMQYDPRRTRVQSQV